MMMRLGYSCFASSGLCFFHDGFDHLTPQAYSLWESWGEVALDVLESILISFKVTEGNAVRPRLERARKSANEVRMWRWVR
jgi:hypothetical protein